MMNPRYTYDSQLEGPSYESPHDLVMEFHEKYKIPIGDFTTPFMLSEERDELRMNLVDEEYNELVSAYDKRDMIEMVDALGDLVYVIYGWAIEMGVNLDAILEEIQRSNMSKLGENGEPIYREDGKVLKGPNFTGPNFSHVLGDLQG